ncbi:hypothetical protein [Halobacteriovorax sp.]|uniref:hypothetical protein n=1 Tax=Halobacteriovorax sp. TaxID=2020862 RepID=UPI003563D664
MTSKENGISSPLEIYKESTQKKSKLEKKKIIIQFIIIFLLSHIARTLVQYEEVTPHIEQKQILQEGHILMELEVSSIIPNDQLKANLINQQTLQEIESVKIIEREITQDGLLRVKLEVPNNKSAWIINKPSNWKLIPNRKVITNKRVNYEIHF